MKTRRPCSCVLCPKSFNVLSWTSTISLYKAYNYFGVVCGWCLLCFADCSLDSTYPAQTSSHPVSLTYKQHQIPISLLSLQASTAFGLQLLDCVVNMTVFHSTLKIVWRSSGAPRTASSNCGADKHFTFCFTYFAQMWMQIMCQRTLGEGQKQQARKRREKETDKASWRSEDYIRHWKLVTDYPASASSDAAGHSECPVNLSATNAGELSNLVLARNQW